VIVAASTRSGNGLGVVIPHLFGCHDSMMVLDIKRENFSLTSGRRALQVLVSFRSTPSPKIDGLIAGTR
jgi:type IV secretory pathway TraG/TraD family ATPase VirD4